MSRQHRMPNKATGIVILGACLLIITIIILIVNAFSNKDNQFITTTNNFLATSVSGENSYVSYLSQHKSSAKPNTVIVIDATEYAQVTGTEFERLQVEGMEGSALYTGETGTVQWDFEVEQAGLYQLEVLYYPVEGKSSSIERIIAIDGVVPFDEAQFIQFDRLWHNELSEIKVDNQGNELRPRQVEAPQWTTKLVQDSNGYITEPFQFYFSKGPHSLSFQASREPMILKELRLKQQQAVPT
ncbi:MAG TPA: ABC transporter substrate-binding protein, partial [Candidatus Paenibacillus intestinavium]|nr:ABC transporter substrate-binding protein [Candidatus Paenibacillus intestinavium]